QKLVIVIAGGHRKFGQRRSHPGKTEITFGCDSLAFLQACFAPLPPRSHLLRRSETPLPIRMQQPARESVVDGRVVTKRGEDVVNETAVVVDVARLLTNHPGHAMSFG